MWMLIWKLLAFCGGAQAWIACPILLVFILICSICNCHEIFSHGKFKYWNNHSRNFLSWNNFFMEFSISWNLIFSWNFPFHEINFSWNLFSWNFLPEIFFHEIKIHAKFLQSTGPSYWEMHRLFLSISESFCEVYIVKH